jgi:excinuclease UvrABC nuclease subunit
MKYKEFEIPSCLGASDLAGVYGIFVKPDHNKIEKCLYIGSSKNIKKRILSSLHPYMRLWNRGICAYSREIICDNFLEIEKLLIKKYRPFLNKQHKSYKNA